MESYSYKGSNPSSPNRCTSLYKVIEIKSVNVVAVEVKAGATVAIGMKLMTVQNVPIVDIFAAIRKRNHHLLNDFWRTFNDEH